MHRILKGARKMLREEPTLLILLGASFLLLLWNIRQRDAAAGVALVMLALLLLGMGRAFYEYGKSNAAERGKA